jgi:hypothetical protein
VIRSARYRGGTIPIQIGAVPLGAGVIHSERHARTASRYRRPERRLTLRQGGQARNDFAVILARLPTRAKVGWIALRLTLGALAAIVAVALLLGR